MTEPLSADLLRRDVDEWNRRIDAGESMPSLLDAQLTGARLTGASLIGAWMTGARLNGAQLDEARLIGARLIGAQLIGARLIGAWLDGAQLDRTRLNGAIVVEGCEPLPPGAFSRAHEIGGYSVRYWHAADGTVLYVWAGCRRGTPQEMLDRGRSDGRTWVPLLEQSIALAEAAARWEATDG